MGKRRRPFTLIEIFLSVGLIALIGTVVLIRTKPMIDHHRINHGYDKLRREIALAKHLAQVANAEVTFHIENKKNHLMCNRTTDEPLILPGIIDTPIIIPHLQLAHSQRETILIVASGWIDAKHKITLRLGKQQKTLHLTQEVIQ